MSYYNKLSKLLWGIWILTFLLFIATFITAFTIPNIQTDVDRVKTYSSLVYCYSVSYFVGFLCWFLLLILNLNNAKGSINVILSGFFGFVLSIISGSSLSYYAKNQLPMT